MLARQHPRFGRRIAGIVGAWTLALLLCLTLAACNAPTATQPRVAPAAGTNAPGRTLVVLGASDAFGVGTFDPDRENWPARLADDLPQPTRLVNLGVPGATLAQAQQEELPIATAQRPQIVVIWLAVNDIINDVPLATYSAELRAMLATLRKDSPASQVFVGNVPDLTQLPYFDGSDPVALRAQIDAWNAAIAQDCAAEGAHLANLASAWGAFSEHPEYISRDGLHPSNEGAQALANFFDLIIRQDLNIPG